MDDAVPIDPLVDADYKIGYRDSLGQEAYDREIALVFRKSWLVLGHDLEIPNPGDYFVRDLPGLKANVLIVRGADGVVRAFHNACRHRGAMLACDGGGNKRRGLSCRYHGWTYELDGRLRGITDRDQFPEQDVDHLSLRPIRCEVRHTFIYINFDEQAAGLDSWLEGLADSTMYEGYFEQFHSFKMNSVVVEANWKLVMDNFNEGYHTLFVHKNTLSDYQQLVDNPMRHILAMDVMKRHLRTSVPANMSHRTIPVEDLAFRHTLKSTPSYYGNSEGLPHGLNFGNLEHWAFDVIKLFPNAMFLPGKNFCAELRVWPISPDRTLLETGTLLPKPKTYGERVAQEYPYVLGREIQCEDLGLLESQQQLLSTGSVEELNLSYQEFSLAQNYRNIRNMVEEGLKAGARQ